MRIEEKDGKLVIVDFDEFDAYKIALNVEKSGLDFYEKLAQETKDEKLKGTLKFLGREENEHIRYFQDALTRLREEKEDPEEDNDLLDAMSFGIIQPYLNHIEDVEQIVNDPKEALKLGILIEQRSIEFYQSCLEKVSGEETKKELSKIIEEEKYHKSLFQELLSR